eukprot:2367007-Lingulodinium_polyedra.AAC.1
MGHAEHTDHTDHTVMRNMFIIHTMQVILSIRIRRMMLIVRICTEHADQIYRTDCMDHPDHAARAAHAVRAVHT